MLSGAGYLAEVSAKSALQEGEMCYLFPGAGELGGHCESWEEVE